MIRFSHLNVLKWNLIALTGFTTLKSGETLEIVIAVVMYVGINCLPIFYGVLLYKKAEELKEEKTVKTIGTLYDGLRIDALPVPDRESDFNKVWNYPAVFMYRRSLFIIITVALFDYPQLQMPAHQALSIVYIGYLCKSNLFESRLRQAVEVASEFLCILTCVFMQ